MILSAIVAMSKNHVIGVDNKLPWNIPEDMKYFKDMTTGKIMIMGRKTYESLGKPLPKRFHIIITRQADYKVDHPDVVVVKSVQEAIDKARGLIGKYPEEVMVIGGGEIYKESLSQLNRIYLTLIDQEIKGDTTFPEVKPTQFKLVSQSKRPGPPEYSFQVYESTTCLTQ